MIKGSINLATKTSDTIDVDLWYIGAKELASSNFDLGRLAQMKDIFGSRIKF